MAKYQKRKTKVKKKSSKLYYLLILLSIFSFISIGVGIYLFLDQKTIITKPIEDEINDDELLAKLKDILKEEKQKIKKDISKKIDKKSEKIEENIPTISSEIEKIDQIQAKHELKKPKLAIIIDDVSFFHHVKEIKSIPYKVTPSILPPTKRHPHSAKIAKDFKIYMVHLPLEAKHHASPEQRTLKAGESYKNMEIWIKKVKKWFPRAVYYNGHTGSKFTEDLASMDKLFKILKSENLKFIDSKTTPNSKATIVAKKYSLKLFNRDVFLDNVKDTKAIKKQIKYAVKVAKENGFAIAIGHPYSSTIKALKESQSLLKDVKLVYVNEL